MVKIPTVPTTAIALRIQHLKVTRAVIKCKQGPSDARAGSSQENELIHPRALILLPIGLSKNMAHYVTKLRICEQCLKSELSLWTCVKDLWK